MPPLRFVAVDASGLGSACATANRDQSALPVMTGLMIAGATNWRRASNTIDPIATPLILEAALAFNRRCR
jgi:hypothetical protein